MKAGREVLEEGMEDKEENETHTNCPTLYIAETNHSDLVGQVCSAYRY